MQTRTARMTLICLAGAGVLFLSSAPARSAGQHLERHFPAADRPVVTIQNVGNGRIEVKSWRNPEIVISGTQASDKVSVEMEQVGNRVALSTRMLDKSARPEDLEADFQLTVPEETELQIRTESGLIYVEQVYGDMTLETVAGDVHLKEVSGYVIVKTVGGSLICTQCAGKLNFNSISGHAQFLQPQLTNVNAYTMSGNVLFDGEFLRTGIYTMRSGTGLVEVRFSSTDSFDLNAHTTSGKVDNQATSFLKPDSHGLTHLMSRGGRALVGTVNAGLAKVELSSFSGTIRIRKRD